MGSDEIPTSKDTGVKSRQQELLSAGQVNDGGLCRSEDATMVGWCDIDWESRGTFTP